MRFGSLAVAFLVAVLIALAPADAKAAETGVVTVVNELADGAATGSGFLFSSDGRILTCYHVVEGARKLQVFSSSGAVAAGGDVIVEAIAPDFDLAILKVRRFAGEPFLPLSDRTPAGGEEVEIHGAAARLEQQQLRAYVTRAPVMSGAIRGKRGERLFALPDVSLIPLQATVYDGLSGGPVVSRGKVIGLLSGSLNEGGAIAWAIPVSYVSRAVAVMTAASSMNWPPLKLMASTWKNLRRSVGALSPALRELDFYLESLDALERAQNGYIAALTKTRVEYDMLKAILPKDPNDSSGVSSVGIVLSRLEKSDEAVNASMDAMFKAYATMVQRMFNLSSALGQYAEQVPYVPANLETIRKFEKETQRIKTELDRISAELQRSDEAVKDIMSFMARGIGPEQSRQQVLTTMRVSIQRLVTFDWVSLQRNLVRRCQEYRAMATAVDELVRAEMVPFGRTWTYRSPAGVALRFPAGNWELGERMNLDVVAQNRREYAKFGHTYDQGFPNWRDRTPGKDKPRALLILSTKNAPGMTPAAHEQSLRYGFGLVPIRTETFGSKTALVLELPPRTPDERIIVIEYLEGARIVRLMLAGDSADVNAMMPEFRSMVSSMQVQSLAANSYP